MNSLSNFLVTQEVSRAIFVAGLCAGALGVSAVAWPVSLNWKRRLYWGGWTASAILLGLYVLNRGPATAVLAACSLAAVTVIFAFYVTPFLKIGGKVRTFWLANMPLEPGQTLPTVPPDSYGERVDAASMWWTLAGIGLCTGLYAVLTGWLAPAGIAGGAILAGLLAVIAHLDRKEGFPVARGNYVAFAIVVLASIPTLLWPVAVYFAAYYATHPVRRDDDA